jgi:hypothetical protein
VLVYDVWHGMAQMAQGWGGRGGDQWIVYACTRGLVIASLEKGCFGAGVVIGERVRGACRGDECGVGAGGAMVVAPVAVVEAGTASVGLDRAAFHRVC